METAVDGVGCVAAEGEESFESYAHCGVGRLWVCLWSESFEHKIGISVRDAFWFQCAKWVWTMMEMVKRTYIYGRNTVLLRKVVAYKTNLALVGLVLSPLSSSLFCTQRPLPSNGKGKGRGRVTSRDIWSKQHLVSFLNLTSLLRTGPMSTIVWINL